MRNEIILYNTRTNNTDKYPASTRHYNHPTDTKAVVTNLTNHETGNLFHRTGSK